MRIIFFLAVTLRFPCEDVIAILFSGTHKSLTLGMPLLNIIFADNETMLVINSIPLLLYHPSQILLGSVLSDRLKKWFLDKKHESNEIQHFEPLGHIRP